MDLNRSLSAYMCLSNNVRIEESTYFADFGIRGPELDGSLYSAQHLLAQPHYPYIVPCPVHPLELLRGWRGVFEAGRVARAREALCDAGEYLELLYRELARLFG